MRHLRFRLRGVMIVVAALYPTATAARGADLIASIPPIRLDHPDFDANDYSSAAVAIRNRQALLCAARRSGFTGSCLVFERPFASGPGWTFSHEIENPQPRGFDNFGAAVALSQAYALIGVIGDDVGALNTGAVSVHSEAGNWPHAGTLVAPSPVPEHVFGSALAVSGDTLVVGAPTINRFGSNVAGAYVFERAGSDPIGWQFRKVLQVDGLVDSAKFGTSVAAFGDWIAVGAPRESSKGAAYVFERDLGGQSNWGLLVRLVAPDGVADEQFGESIAINSQTLAIGAPARPAEIGSGRGAVYVFSPPAWVYQQTLQDDALIGVGTSLALDRDLLAVGAPGDLGVSQLSGRVLLYTNAVGSSSWVFGAELSAPGPPVANAFGSRLAIYNDDLIVGSPREGAAYVFVLERSASAIPAVAPVASTLLVLLLGTLGVQALRSVDS